MYLLIFILFAIPSLIVVTRLALTLFPENHLPKDMQVRKDPSFIPQLAVIVPCYNEGQAVYNTIKSIAESGYPLDKMVILPQDDGSVDDSWEWILKASRDFSRVFPERNAQNMGKTESYLRAMERSDSEIILVVDSDTIMGKDSINKITACFADERLGVVGAPLGVLNPNENMFTAIQTYIYFFGLRFAKIPESHFQGVAVIGGFALAVRRSILQELAPQIRNRNWFGVPVKDGEDRFITHLAILRGWGTYVEQGADVWTYAINKYDKYFGQQLRWKRSLLRTYMWVIRTLPYHVKNMRSVPLFAVFGSGTIAVIMFLGVLYQFIANPAGIFSPLKLIIWAGASSLVMIICAHSTKLRDQMLRNPLKMSLFVAWWVVNVFYLVFLSFLLLDQDAWGNREIKPVKEIQNENG
jgi:hyaluronan synthase